MGGGVREEKGKLRGKEGGLLDLIWLAVKEAGVVEISITYVPLLMLASRNFMPRDFSASLFEAK